MNFAPLPDSRSFSGVQASLVTRSIRTANRCTNVPRRLSCPTRRTERPSTSSEPKAAASAVAQSMSPAVNAAARRSNCGATFACRVNPAGGVRCTAAIRARTSGATAVTGDSPFPPGGIGFSG